MSHSVTIKSHGEIINIVLDSSVEFEVLAADLRKKVSDAKNFFEGATTNVSFNGRDLTKEEEEKLLEAITTETTMDVTLVNEEPMVLPPLPVRIRKSKKTEVAESGGTSSTVSDPTKTEKNKEDLKLIVAPSTTNHETSDTIYHHGGLRSGQSIKFNGSVVVLGDVNPGSEIVADGNVIVLGSLKGLAHAGASGDTSCFVSALVLQPIQLRIANIITSVPPPDKKSKKAVQKAQLAYVKDGQVFVGPL